MKLPFTRLCILAAVWMILGSATPTIKHPSPSVKQTFYYWYWTDTDSYHQWATTATEINDIENLIGLLVNTNQAGGTHIANGYTNNNYPHTTVPTVLLYAH